MVQHAQCSPLYNSGATRACEEKQIHYLTASLDTIERSRCTFLQVTTPDFLTGIDR